MKTVYPRDDEMRRNNRRNINVSVAYTVAAPAGTRLTINSISGNDPGDRHQGRSVGQHDQRRACASPTPAASPPQSRSPATSRSSTRRPTARRGAERQRQRRSAEGHRAAHRRRQRQRHRSSVRTSSAIASKPTRSAATSSSAAPLAKGGRYELNSHSGDVRVALAGGRASSSKRIPSAAQSARTFRSPCRGSRPGSGGRRAIRGVYGDGSAVLERHDLLRKHGHYRSVKPPAFAPAFASALRRGRLPTVRFHDAGVPAGPAQPGFLPCKRLRRADLKWHPPCSLPPEAIREPLPV